MNNKIEKSVNYIIETYNSVVKVVDKDAVHEEDRAYGGVVRSVKGKLQEFITEQIIKTAWESLRGDEKRLLIDSRKHKIPIKKDYIEQLEDNELREHILENISEYYFGLSVDKQIYIDEKFVIGIECKAYTENAMLKRILVDFSLLKTIYPDISCYLFQLESQLGGDYSELKEITFGSKPTHTLMSYFPSVKLNIITFLKGERKVDEPIHKDNYFKTLEKVQIEKAISLIESDLKRYL